MTPVQQVLLALERDIAAGRITRGRALVQAYEEFGLSETRYYQQVNATLDDPDALVAYPAVIRRLQRLQDQARAARRTPRASRSSSVRG